jgi:spore coat polysaccharide biosynthesis protein SpsF
MTTTFQIVIQARSTNERFPRKLWQDFVGEPVLTHVLKNAMGARRYLNSYTARTDIKTTVTLATPVGDPIALAWKDFCSDADVTILEGDEHDVLSRYLSALKIGRSDYIVRITSDCPLLSRYVISRHIRLAMNMRYDYLTNGIEPFRTAPDGFDCEVISRRLLEHLGRVVTESEDKEHVTSYVHRNLHGTMPDMSMGFILHGMGSCLDGKLSVDTVEDLERVSRLHTAWLEKRSLAVHKFGKEHVYDL